MRLCVFRRWDTETLTLPIWNACCPAMSTFGVCSRALRSTWTLVKMILAWSILQRCHRLICVYLQASLHTAFHAARVHSHTLEGFRLFFKENEALDLDSLRQRDHGRSSSTVLVSTLCDAEAFVLSHRFVLFRNVTRDVQQRAEGGSGHSGEHTGGLTAGGQKRLQREVWVFAAFPSGGDDFLCSDILMGTSFLNPANDGRNRSSVRCSLSWPGGVWMPSPPTFMKHSFNSKLFLLLRPLSWATTSPSWMT